MRVVSSIGLDSLEVSSIFAAWMRGSPSLDGFLPRRPSSIDELVEEAASVDPHDGALRSELVEAVRASLGPELASAQERALEGLAHPEALAIVTGQQPCVFGGPLYVTHKAATACRLARMLREALRARGVDRPVVPVFWNHDEDHDWGEANQVSFVNPALDVQRVRLRLPSTGVALGHLPVGEVLMRAVDEARDLIVQTEWGLRELDAFRPAAESATLADVLTSMLSRHFGDEGLLVLEATRLPTSCRAMLRRWHEDAEGARGGTKLHASALVDRGFDVTVDPEQALLFGIAEGSGRRRALPDGERCPLDQTPSAGVLLRPIWQDALLPSLAYVAGPGEVSYLALAESLYARFGVRRPALVPRASIVLGDPRVLELLQRFELEVPALREGALALEARIADAAGEPSGDERDAERVEERVREAARVFRETLRSLDGEIARIDAHLVHPLHRIAKKSVGEVDRFAQKIARQRRNRSGRFRQHARRLCAELYPRASLQERVLPLLPFVARGGAGFARDLVEVADPFARAQVLVEWQPAGGEAPGASS